ncbi:MAG: pyridoxal 5'-phosphate synthase glutaminase subunit PdxT [Selenomonas sp.]|nr:pyridoxal 5'-phosphate synthase glutaminase subunit PdxT [Selenomonas sp.]
MSACAAKKPQIGVLALQGAFIEHEEMLQRLGADCHEIRERADLAEPMDGLVLPGGESTTQKKLLADLDLFGELRRRIADGLPVLATCAGLILLAKDATQDACPYPGFATLPVRVRRNAYGRQLGSFVTTHALKGLGPIPMTFIRAPYIEKAAPDVDVLATVDDHIVAVKYHHQIGLAFHPELGKDTRIHEAFLKMTAKN